MAEQRRVRLDDEVWTLIDRAVAEQPKYSPADVINSAVRRMYRDEQGKMDVLLELVRQTLAMLAEVNARLDTGHAEPSSSAPQATPTASPNWEAFYGTALTSQEEATLQETIAQNGDPAADATAKPGIVSRLFWKKE